MGPGCFVRPWAAARPRDRHTRACGSEWSISKPGQAPPPPTGAAAWPTGPSGALHTSGAWSLMCGSARRLEARPGPAAARGRRSQAHQSLRHRASNPSRAPRPGPVDQAARLSETAVTFAGVGRASTETGVAFAGEQRAFLVRFSVAVVSSVSTVAIQGRAVVMVVSSSPRHSCPCVKKFALLGLMLGVSATKFAQRAQNGPNSAFCGVLGEFFAEMPVEGRCWANFVTAWAWQLGPTTGSVNPSMRS